MDVLSLIVACFSVAVALPSAMLAWHDLRLRRRADPVAQQQPAPAPAANPPHGSLWPPPPSPHPAPPPSPAPVPSWWTAPPTAAPPPFAPPMPLGRRVLAYYIDMFAPMLPLVVVHGVTSRPDGSSAAVDGLGYNTALGNALSFVYIGLAILNLAWSSRSGRSFGKVVLGGRTLDTGTGRPVGWGRTVARNALLLVPFLAFTALLRRDRRGVHDLVCGASVVRANAGAAVQQWAPAYPQLQWAAPPSSPGGSQHV